MAGHVQGTPCFGHRPTHCKEIQSALREKMGEYRVDCQRETSNAAAYSALTAYIPKTRNQRVTERGWVRIPMQIMDVNVVNTDEFTVKRSKSAEGK